MTFSVVARDPEIDAVGVALRSTFASVGAFVPFAAADGGGEDRPVDAIRHGLRRYERT